MTTVYAAAEASLLRILQGDPLAAGTLADEVAALTAAGHTDFALSFLEALVARAPRHARIRALQSAIDARPASELDARRARDAKRAAYFSPEAVAARAAAEVVPPLERARRALRERMQADLDARAEAERLGAILQQAEALHTQSCECSERGDHEGAAVLLADAAILLRAEGLHEEADRAVDLALGRLNDAGAPPDLVAEVARLKT